jgi:hypothetical protein
MLLHRWDRLEEIKYEGVVLYATSMRSGSSLGIFPSTSLKRLHTLCLHLPSMYARFNADVGAVTTAIQRNRDVLRLHEMDRLVLVVQSASQREEAEQAVEERWKSLFVVDVEQ